ncbi:MAG: hypothetical protein EA359_17710 [Balneolaceae bacterium]|nr:MAG: hypothetical protein EA359_17710 [Balneolaceae bacterium]
MHDSKNYIITSLSNNQNLFIKKFSRLLQTIHFLLWIECNKNGTGMVEKNMGSMSSINIFFCIKVKILLC